MFIAIVGTPSSGKGTVLDYLLTKHAFERIGLSSPNDPMAAAQVQSTQLETPPIENLSVSSSSTPSHLPTTPSTSSFPDSATMLDHVTRNWRSNLVTTDLTTYDDVKPFVKRPFFMLLSVDGPLRTRFQRERARRADLTLDTFIDDHDLLLNGPSLSNDVPLDVLAKHPQTDFRRIQAVATLQICNDFPSVDGLWAYLDQLDLMNEERLRPGWDTYFMTLASLASHRSNCMKRRVGALLVRSKRILSTGYNGTARNTRNCNQGGCSRCNGSARGGEALNECLCLHAEENALLEAGKERIGEDSILYCNTCPCLRCSVKIVQCGVREVVYNQSYSMDEASARVFQEAGVILRRLQITTDIHASLL